MEIDIGLIISIASAASIIIGFIVFGQKQKDRTHDFSVKEGERNKELEYIKMSLDASHNKHRSTDERIDQERESKIEMEMKLDSICNVLSKIEAKMDILSSELLALKERFDKVGID